MQCAASSSGRVRLNDPRNDLARAVRELATMTASLMRSPMSLSYAQRVSLSPASRRRLAEVVPGLSGTLRGRNLLFVELGKSLALFRQALQKRSRCPQFSLLFVEFANALLDLLQSHRVGMPHRAAPIGGKSVPVEINDVDVDCPQRVSLFQNPRSLIHQRIDTTIDDLRCGNLPLRDSRVRVPLSHQGGQFGIRAGAPVFVVPVPSPQRFLAVPTHFTKTVLGERLADSGFFQVAVLFANAPAHVETRQVARGQRTHGVAEVDERLVYRLHLRPFFDQELRFPPIRTKHAVADEAAAVSHQNPDLADRKSTRLNSSHLVISYAVFCLKKKKKQTKIYTSVIAPLRVYLYSSM